MAELIDTHAHIYLNRFESDRNDIIDRARASGVITTIMPAIDVASVHQALALCEKYDGLYAMAALHPSETKDASDADFDAIRSLIQHPLVIAVGESGLDYYWDRSFDEKQQAFFRKHIQLSIEEDLPLIIHMRDKQGRDEVHKDLIRILKEERENSNYPERLRGIFHCFGGPNWLIDEAKTLNFLLGIGGTVTFRNSGVSELVRDIDLYQIVLETDAPYLAPVPYRGKRNEPSYVRLVAEKVAEVKGIDVTEVAEITSKNARALFKI